MFKKLTSLAIGVVVAVSLCACGTVKKDTNKASNNQKYEKIIRDASKKLRSTYADYIVTNTIESPNDTSEYLEVMHGDVSYTEYSVDKDNKLGTIKYGTSNSISYALTDWLDSDGKYYMFTTDKDKKSVIYKLNEGYKKYVEDRPYLYVNKLLDSATSISKYDDLTLDLGEGSEKFDSYKIKVKGSALKEIFGANSYGMYKSLVDDKSTDKNIVKLCKYYLQDLDMNLTFSDANVVVGIDTNGILKYVCIEAGGLGSRMYFTKAVVATKNNNVRNTPDFTNAVDFSTSLKELADYVSSYKNYDEALKALNEKSGVDSTNSTVKGEKSDTKKSDTKTETKSKSKLKLNKEE